MTAHFYSIWPALQPYLPAQGWIVAFWATIITVVTLRFTVDYLSVRRRWRAQFPEPSLITENAQFETVRGKRLRILHLAHPDGTDVPLFFFLHGVGSRIAVWEKQVERLRKVGNILALDLVGHGESEEVSSWEAYTTESLVQDIIEGIAPYTNYRIVVIAHSYGNCLAIKLFPHIQASVAGMVLIAPGDVTHPPHVTRLLQFPEWIIEIFRMLDRYGGTESTSVRRMVYKTADPELKELQLFWNESSRTSVFRRTMLGMAWVRSDDFRAITCPLLLIPGEFDPIHPVPCSYAIRECVGTKQVRIVVGHQVAHQVMLEKPDFTNTEIMRFVEEECNLIHFTEH
ncbi:hypothetical protein H4R33_003224 [Dimargaris cristalligena]|uniref:Alpha/Beta hydrolase protein n=1 Tax=Dimargaris cristalligena TaxID=215637 RepID=A0A4Q0A166_9FUNG|nr:hypothetical protein H4R33_003224 [Dimargaris cristalligena]RKP39191.1 Alpha/Beta hydrolase protein [Dimargaris cristalligena]|eukprot:RKP39191.1 Alpha/Beta hydrolase protein [Dimargaris cristalligena]